MSNTVIYVNFKGAKAQKPKVCSGCPHLVNKGYSSSCVSSVCVKK